MERKTKGGTYGNQSKTLTVFFYLEIIFKKGKKYGKIYTDITGIIQWDCRMDLCKAGDSWPGAVYPTNHDDH